MFCTFIYKLSVYILYIHKSSFKSIYIYTYFYKTYLFSRGNDFRKDFQDLSCLKAYFTDIQMLAVTATAPPSTIHLIQKVYVWIHVKLLQ